MTLGPDPGSMRARRRGWQGRIASALGATVVALLLVSSCGGDSSEGETTAGGGPAPEPGEPMLRVEPPVVAVAAGQRYWVEIRLDAGDEAEGIDFEITFDPQYVRIEDSVPDAAGVQIRVDALCDSPNNVRQDVVQNEVDNDAGVIRFRSTWSSARQLCRDALIASLDVRGVAEGGCPFRFAVAELVGADGEKSPVERPGNGLILVSASQGTPEPGAETESTMPAPSGSPAPGGAVYHTVQTGETLLGIALQYGTTVDAIVAANGLQDPDAVGVGQKLVIPPAGSSGDEPADAPEDVPDDQGEATYVVQAGDTLTSIARRFGTTVEVLAELNGLTEPYQIVAGETLRVR